MEKDAQSYRPLLGQDDEAFQGAVTPRRSRRSHSLHLWSWMLQLGFFLVSATMFLSSLQFRLSPSERCIDEASAYSPALTAFGSDYRLERFNGTVNRESRFKGPPTAARIQAWDEISNQRAIGIGHDTLRRINAPESSVKIPEELGGGYWAAVEMLHQVHCVKALWLNTWPEFYRSDAGNSSAGYRQHLDHCADLLRQKLLCDADAGLLTANWVTGLDHHTPNFNTLHKCRRWEDLIDWVREHEVDEFLHEFAPPPDAVILDDFP